MAGGMVAVVLVFIVFFGSDFVMTSDRWLIVVASLAMFALGLWDDLYSMGAKRKLALQLLIASATYFLGISISDFRVPFVNHVIELGIWSWPVTVLWLVALTNLINLIDGVDGLAGGICLMLLVLLLYVSNVTGSVPIITAGMIGAIVGFLRFNFPPARIYMGDGGAYFLGFLIGSTTIVTAQKGTIFAGLVAPLFVLALPIIDTSLAIMRRGLRGLPLFRPDRKHIHHRLLAMGHSRRKVVLGLYAFTAFFLLLGFVTFCFHGQYFPLIVGVGVLTVLLVAGRLNFSREWFSIGRVVGNSLMSRQDVQYAMCLSKWLAMEGTRAESIENLAEDAVIMACKLGFSSVRIRLEDGEKFWQIDDSPVETQEFFRHGLPGRKDCTLELGVPKPVTSIDPPVGAPAWHTESTFEVLADLLAEGWVKAVGDWEKINQMPARFTATSHSGELDTQAILRRFKASQG
jgi:UDP-GlcNAc:undecaprenyl-phosphate GlcNAc-1-phosphate transferase